LEASFANIKEKIKALTDPHEKLRHVRHMDVDLKQFSRKLSFRKKQNGQGSQKYAA